MGLNVETRMIDRKNTGFPNGRPTESGIAAGQSRHVHRGPQSYCILPQDARLRSASLAGWNPHVWDRERARDPQADQARGFKAQVYLIEDESAIPKRVQADDERLARSARIIGLNPLYRHDDIPERFVRKYERRRYLRFSV